MGILELVMTKREDLARRICADLEQAVPGSYARLRGSLAEDRADAFSDIDVEWDVPDDAFPQALPRARETLERVRAVESFRSDPDFQNSAKRRLFFVRFRDTPLFWRLDLAVFALSVAGDQDYDHDNSAARGNDWSLTESALANAIAGMKAHLRHNDQEANALVQRAYARLGLADPQTDLRNRLMALVSWVDAIDPRTALYGDRIRRLADAVFGDSE
jgi:predicted nucleotidyltransferase